MTLYSKKGHRGGLGCNKSWSMFALYNHTEVWNCTNACSLSGLQINVFGRHQITHVWRDIRLISNKLWPSHAYLGCSFCALALCTHSHHRLCHRRVKMQIINPILFHRKAGERDDLELWVWNPVWIVPNLTRVHWKCVCQDCRMEMSEILLLWSFLAFISPCDGENAFPYSSS